MSRFDITTAEVLPDHDFRSDEQKLEAAIATLRAFADRSPKLSHAAERARHLLSNVEDPDCSLTTPEKLSALREKLRSYANERRLDSILHNPGDRPHT